MDALLLAAGYATRLYPLTRDFPKPLLPLAGRPLMDYVTDQLEAVPQIERLWLVSNDRFFSYFQEWSRARTFDKPVEVLNDGSTSNEERLGAVRDIHFALQRIGDIPEDGVYVLATDNIPRFDLGDIVRLSAQKQGSAVFACKDEDPVRLRRCGVAVVDPEGRIVGFEEKPEHPKSNLRVPPFYVYTCGDVALVARYVEEGNDPDAPGHFLAWLVGQRIVWARLTDSGTYDIGTIESYREVCEVFERRSQDAGA